MLKDIYPENLFIFDIETVPAQEHYKNLPSGLIELWENKAGRLKKDDETPDQFYFEHAGIYAEFGKIVVISCAHLVKLEKDIYQLRIKTLSNHDEQSLLIDFIEIIQKSFNRKSSYQLCGHNIKEFDVPWLCRRMLIQGIKLPEMLDLAGKKPWEVNHVDTLELWKFGDYKHYTSLNLLAHLFQIPTPKDKMDGSQVGNEYWIKNNLSGIAEYCSKDVITVAQIILKMKGIPLIIAENMIHVN